VAGVDPGRARRFQLQAPTRRTASERGVDYSTTVDHIVYITRLLDRHLRHCATRVGPVGRPGVRCPTAPVALRSERCRKVLGVAVTDEEIVDRCSARPAARA